MDFLAGDSDGPCNADIKFSPPNADSALSTGSFVSDPSEISSAPLDDDSAPSGDDVAVFGGPAEVDSAPSGGDFAPISDNFVASGGPLTGDSGTRGIFARSLGVAAPCVLSGGNSALSGYNTPCGDNFASSDDATARELFGDCPSDDDLSISDTSSSSSEEEEEEEKEKRVTSRLLTSQATPSSSIANALSASTTLQSPTSLVGDSSQLRPSSRGSPLCLSDTSSDEEDEEDGDASRIPTYQAMPAPSSTLSLSTTLRPPTSSRGRLHPPPVAPSGVPSDSHVQTVSTASLQHSAPPNFATPPPLTLEAPTPSTIPTLADGPMPSNSSGVRSPLISQSPPTSLTNTASSPSRTVVECVPADQSGENLDEEEMIAHQSLSVQEPQQGSLSPLPPSPPQWRDVISPIPSSPPRALSPLPSSPTRPDRSPPNSPINAHHTTARSPSHRAPQSLQGSHHVPTWSSSSVMSPLLNSPNNIHRAPARSPPLSPLPCSPIDAQRRHALSPLPCSPIDAQHGHTLSPLPSSPIDAQHGRTLSPLPSSPINAQHGRTLSPLPSSPIDVQHGRTLSPLPDSPCSVHRSSIKSPTSVLSPLPGSPINTHHPSASSRVLSPLPQSPTNAERSFISPLPPSPYSARHRSRSRSILSPLPPSPVRCGRPSSLNLLTQFADVAPSQADLPRPIPAESAVPHSETVVPSPGPTSDDAQSTFHVSEGSPFSPPSPSAHPLLASQCVLEKSSQMAPVPSAEIALVARSLPSWSDIDAQVGTTSCVKTVTSVSEVVSVSKSASVQPLLPQSVLEEKTPPPSSEGILIAHTSPSWTGTDAITSCVTTVASVLEEAVPVSTTAFSNSASVQPLLFQSVLEEGSQQPDAITSCVTTVASVLEEAVPVSTTAFGNSASVQPLLSQSVLEEGSQQPLPSWTGTDANTSCVTTVASVLEEAVPVSRTAFLKEGVQMALEGLQMKPVPSTESALVAQPSLSWTGADAKGGAALCVTTISSVPKMLTPDIVATQPGERKGRDNTPALVNSGTILGKRGRKSGCIPCASCPPKRWNLRSSQRRAEMSASPYCSLDRPRREREEEEEEAEVSLLSQSVLEEGLQMTPPPSAESALVTQPMPSWTGTASCVTTVSSVPEVAVLVSGTSFNNFTSVQPLPFLEEGSQVTSSARPPFSAESTLARSRTSPGPSPCPTAKVETTSCVGTVSSVSVLEEGVSACSLLFRSSAGTMEGPLSCNGGVDSVSLFTAGSPLRRSCRMRERATPPAETTEGPLSCNGGVDGVSLLTAGPLPLRRSCRMRERGTPPAEATEGPLSCNGGVDSVSLFAAGPLPLRRSCRNREKATPPAVGGHSRSRTPRASGCSDGGRNNASFLTECRRSSRRRADSTSSVDSRSSPRLSSSRERMEDEGALDSPLPPRLEGTTIGSSSTPKTLTPDIVATQPGEGKGRDNTSALVNSGTTILGKRERKAGCNSCAEASSCPPKRWNLRSSRQRAEMSASPYCSLDHPRREREEEVEAEVSFDTLLQHARTKETLARAGKEQRAEEQAERIRELKFNAMLARAVRHQAERNGVTNARTRSKAAKRQDRRNREQSLVSSASSNPGISNSGTTPLNWRALRTVESLPSQLTDAVTPLDMSVPDGEESWPPHSPTSALNMGHHPRSRSLTPLGSLCPGPPHAVLPSTDGKSSPPQSPTPLNVSAEENSPPQSPTPLTVVVEENSPPQSPTPLTVVENSPPQSPAPPLNMDYSPPRLAIVTSIDGSVGYGEPLPSSSTRPTVVSTEIVSGTRVPGAVGYGVSSSAAVGLCSLVGGEGGGAGGGETTSLPEDRQVKSSGRHQKWSGVPCPAWKGVGGGDNSDSTVPLATLPSSSKELSRANLNLKSASPVIPTHRKTLPTPVTQHHQAHHQAPPISIAQRQLNKAMQCPLPLPQWLVAAMTEVQAMYLHCSATSGYYNQKKKRKDRLIVPIQRNGCQDPVNCKFNGSSDTEKRA